MRPWLRGESPQRGDRATANMDARRRGEIPTCRSRREPPARSPARAKDQTLTDMSRQQVAEFITPFRIEPRTKVDITRFDPAHTADVPSEKAAKILLEEGTRLLADYQTRLAAEARTGVLLCLQGIDAAGKDSTISHVMIGMNPQGVRVNSFKVPSTEELQHDYLWRYAKELPAAGTIAIFNRSHYEEVLVVRVHPAVLEREKLANRALGSALWATRYEEINNWERYLADNGIKLVKVLLNISKDEQRARFLRRLELPDHAWKFSVSDLEERRYWDAYQQAFSEMLSNTSTESAPWFVVPADHKWFARVCVSHILAGALMELDPKFPEVSPEEQQQLARARAELLEQS